MMSHSDCITARSRAIRFFGEDRYKQMLRVAEQYFLDNNISIPSDGVERMPGFWATINEIIHDELSAR